VKKKQNGRKSLRSLNTQWVVKPVKEEEETMNRKNALLLERNIQLYVVISVRVVLALSETFNKAYFAVT
jgi:hypothetical protein